MARTTWGRLALRLGGDKPILTELADDSSRLVVVNTVSVDEHNRLHQPLQGKGPKEQTGIVHLT